MKKLKAIFSNWRIIILLIFLLLAIVAIRPSFGNDGVAVRSVLKNSSAEIGGLVNPDPKSSPMSKEVIKTINGEKIFDELDYERLTSELVVNQTVVIETNKRFYTLTTKPLIEVVTLDETEEIVIQVPVNKTIEVNGSNTTVVELVNQTVLRNKTVEKIIGVEDLGIKVYEAPTSNIRKGLDLQGGTRVLLKPDERLNPNDMGLLLEQMKQRLNVYGLSDIIVREAGDLPPPLGEGNQYIMVEVAGVNEQEVKDLLSKQGKFEAKIGDQIAFKGGSDITYVCRSADCAGIDPYVGCSQVDDINYACRFRFSISLSPEAAKNQAEITKTLGVISVDEDGNPIPEDNQYLDTPLDLYLDNEKVDSLNIGKTLRGNAVTDIQISGTGIGVGQANAVNDALLSMKNLQTVLITGSLPVELEIVKVDTISPVLGEKFMRNILMVGILAILSVAIIVFIRYRTFTVVVPMVIAMISEVILLLGLASLIGWNLDIAAFAGIIIAIGTGVDHQIVIADETLNKKLRQQLTWTQKIKRAFFIIMAAYFTTVVAMLPLWFAGAGLLKGFAVTTIFGVTFGVFITRPAFAAMLEILRKE